MTRAYALCGGGTGGHIFPALAVAAALQSAAVGQPIYYFGKTGGMEEGLTQRAQLPFYGLAVSSLARNFSPRQNLQALFQAGQGFWKARHLLRELNIQAILGTGGFVCGPVMAAAVSLRIASVILESNSIPGLTNRLLSAWVTRVAVSHEQSRVYFPKRKVVLTGFPLRPGLNQPNREQACAVFGLQAQQPVLLIFPGSLAARRINQAVVEMLPQISHRLPKWQLLWMTGEKEYSLAVQASAKIKSRIVIRPFIHEVAEAYAAADLILARAGGGTVAELAAVGKPALLVPYPYATANHQQHNAEVLHKAGSAEVVRDQDITGAFLLKKITELLRRLKPMTECAAVLKAVYPRHGAEQLAKMLVELAGEKRA